MFVFDCEAGYQPDNGQNDVTDGRDRKSVV